MASGVAPGYPLPAREPANSAQGSLGTAWYAPAAQGHIALIACAYNAEAFLECFFACVAQQTCRQFTLVFVDDCSTDDTRAVAQELGTSLPQAFELLHTSGHQGLSAARNVGLDWAGEHPCDYVTFADVDDWFEPAYLQDMLAAARAAEADLCIAGIERYDDETGRTLATEMVHCPTHPVADPATCAHLAFVNPCSYAKLFRCGAIEGVRFRDIARSEDTCFLFDALPQVARVAFTNRALYHYRVAEGTLTSRFDAQAHTSMHDVFAQMMATFQEGPVAPYRHLFETQVFIRSSVGAVLRRVQQGADARLLAREELAWLDAAMPSWRTNPYLQLGRMEGALPHQLAIALCAALYKAGVFAIAPHLYRLAHAVTGKDARA